VRKLRLAGEIRTTYLQTLSTLHHIASQYITIAIVIFIPNSAIAIAIAIANPTSFCHPKAILITNITMQSTTSSTSPLLTRLALPILKFLALTLALYIVPTLIHTAVRSLDALYELLGRRSSSPYTLSVILAASALLVAWHVWVGRLSYKTVVKGKRRSDVSWGRVLGRVIVPGALVVFGLGLMGEVAGRVLRG
jgi:hypothetical protein